MTSLSLISHHLTPPSCSLSPSCPLSHSSDMLRKQLGAEEQAEKGEKRKRRSERCEVNPYTSKPLVVSSQIVLGESGSYFFISSETFFVKQPFLSPIRDLQAATLSCCCSETVTFLHATKFARSRAVFLGNLVNRIEAAAKPRCVRQSSQSIGFPTSSFSICQTSIFLGKGKPDFSLASSFPVLPALKSQIGKEDMEDRTESRRDV